MLKTDTSKSVPPSTWSRPVLWMNESHRARLISEWETRRLRSQRLRSLSIDIEQECELLRCLSKYGAPRTQTFEQRSA